MSLFRSSLRPPAVLSDEAIERYLAAIRAELEPDPLFRRRLRGHVLNRYVAAREGHASGRRVMKEMGRLGRAVLYASVVLGVSVTGAMAVSQQAIPGDALYSLKLQMETLRYEVVPERLHDDLAAHALGERIEELRRLSESGNASAAGAHGAAVDAAYDRVVALSPDGATLAGHLEVADALFERLPEQAQDAVRRALSDAPRRDRGPTIHGAAPPGGGGGSQAGGVPGSTFGGRGTGGSPPAGQPDAPGRSSDAPQPTPRTGPNLPQDPGAAESPKPSMSPRPTRSPSPAGN